jgi:hypothetical protein
MDAEQYAIAASLVFVFLLLVTLVVRSARQYQRSGAKDQIIWGSGLGLAAAAMAVEAVVYFGVPPAPYLPLYVFLSAAIVGVLSLGATKVLGNEKVANGYRVWTVGTLGLVAALCAVVPIPSSIVVGGVISGNPPVLLILTSTLVTGPATIVLLSASYFSLRRKWRWHTLLMIAGALILGAGGVLYIATFPVALYYAEFFGVILLFLGLVSLPTSHASTTPISVPAA